MLRFIRVRIRFRVDNQRIRIRAVSDPELVAVQHIVVTIPLGPQLHGDDIGPGVWFRHR